MFDPIILIVEFEIKVAKRKQNLKIYICSLKQRAKTVSELVSWCFKPSQPQRIISRLRETFIKRYIELKPEEQSEKAECSRENLRNEIEMKGS